MDARRIIAGLRDGRVPDRAALAWFAQGLADGRVSDAQAGAFAMAALLNGLGEEGRVAFTLAMRDSGRRLTWDLGGPVLDKHSTGGIGDCVSLVLAPALAACGAFVPMISGRGLGHTGGTLDKLEAIPGLSTQLDEAQFRAVVARAGCAIVSASADIAPADRRLYAIRDVTATVESLDLITASILSKKLAAGLDGLVLDVKTGSGAILKSDADAKTLAEALVTTATEAGCPTSAVLTDMNQPLAPALGNALEVACAMRVLTGAQPHPAMAADLGPWRGDGAAGAAAGLAEARAGGSRFGSEAGATGQVGAWPPPGVRTPGVRTDDGSETGPIPGRGCDPVPGPNSGRVPGSDSGPDSGPASGPASHEAPETGAPGGDAFDTARLTRVAVELGGVLLAGAGLARDIDAGRAALASAIASGRAAEAFGRMCAAMGGPVAFVDSWARFLPEATVIREVAAPVSGYVAAFDGAALGLAVIDLGGGRQVEGDRIDPAVGISDILPLGSPVRAGQPLARVHAAREDAADRAGRAVRAAITLSPEPPDVPCLIGARIL